MGLVNVTVLTSSDGTRYEYDGSYWREIDTNMGCLTLTVCERRTTVEYGEVYLCKNDNGGAIIVVSDIFESVDGKVYVSDGSCWVCVSDSFKVVENTSDIGVTGVDGKNYILSVDGSYNVVNDITDESIDTTLVFSTGISEVGTSVSSMVVVALPVALAIAVLFISIKLGIRFFRGIAK